MFLPVIFISGVFYSSDNLPEFLKAIAEVLPLKHSSTACRWRSWRGRRGTAALVVAAWAVAGLVLAVRIPLGVERRCVELDCWAAIPPRAV